MNESKPHGLPPTAIRLRRLELPADLATEVAGLCKEIAALRSELRPMPSWLVTGQQAVDEFKRLVVAMPEITGGYLAVRVQRTNHNI